MNADASSISIRTMKDYYSPGENLHGYILLRIKEQLRGSKLSLKIKGKEYTYWLIHKVGLKPGAINNLEVDAAHRAEEVEGKVIFYNHNYTIYEWPNEIIPPGDYSFPFEMVLKDFLPGSYKYERGALDQLSQLEAYITYKIKAELILQDKKKLKYTQELNIREDLKTGINMSQEEMRVNINSCFCLPKGQTHIKCYFDKNSYIPGEDAKLSCEINNSRCSLNIQNVKVKLIRELLFVGDNRTTRGISEKTITSDSEVFSYTLQGVNANQTVGIGPDPRFHVMKIERSADSENKSIQPSVRGQMVKCKYYLQVEIVYEGGCLRFPDGAPLMKIPVTIYSRPIIDKNTGLYSEDFNPIKYDVVPVVLSESSYYKPSEKKKGMVNTLLKEDARIDLVDERNDKVNLLGGAGEQFKKLFK